MLDFTNEIKFTTARSSGAGGQNVNKVNTKVVLHFDVMNSSLLSLPQKLLISEKLASKINNDGILILSCEQTRSQLKNKEIAINLLNNMVSQALITPKKRKATKPTKSSKLKRLQSKKQHSMKKANRKSPEL